MSSLNNLFSKINNKDDNEEVTKEPIEEVMTKVQNKDDNDELSVTLKQPLPEIIVKETIESVFDEQVFDKIIDIITDEQEETIEDLLSVVRSIKKEVPKLLMPTRPVEHSDDAEYLKGSN